MQTLLAVIDDLFQFARSAIFGILSTKLDGGYFGSHELPQEKTLTLFPAITPVTISNGGAQTLSKDALFLQGEQYFIGVHDTYLYTDPVVAFDTASRKLLYGDLVNVQKLGGRWAHVKVNDAEGWIFKDVIREQAKDVFPSLVYGSVYDSLHDDTKKLRMCIDDMFQGEASSLFLTDVEYVTYKLKRKGKNIPWTEERPRIASTWQKKLRGRNGVHITITPKTESVMEFVLDDIGHLCFVEAVFPDDSIKISTIGMYDEGVYTDMMMQKDDWKELRPVFITIQ